ncbi:HdeD family acid-resistance protein [Camelimonas abortus]|uniref:HdeD family acid-resistance protein n=1 Tax=Camelimonas abortus TaxID=1017184 RepID=A0ABV7LG33_9HYPH
MTETQKPAGGAGVPDFDGLRRRLRDRWGWLLALGILLTVLGVIGFVMLPGLTLVTVWWFGALLMIGGGAQIVDAFSEKTWGSFALHLLIAVLYIIAGGVLVINPALGALSITLVIAAALVAVGVLRIIMGFQARPAPGWALAAVSGVLSIILGVMIFAEWPASGVWVLGLFVAIELVSQGVAFIALALAARKA